MASETTSAAGRSSSGGGRGALVSSIALFVLLAVFWDADTSSNTGQSSSSGRQLAGVGGKAHPQYALFFPIICLLVGIVLYYLIARLLHHAFPYTAAMFLFGTIMGTVLERLPENQVTTSFEMWSRIDGHLLILGFLPGLLFRDAYCQNIHLFRKAFGQCSIMAFPGVLAGTALTACVLTFVFPYLSPVVEEGYGEEAFIFSMVLGSILSATDPVAVSALLNEVGAPPRLKTHIAGESLLNDGAAVVFFNIFFNMDLYNFTSGKYGRTFDWGSGIAYFAKLSLGSAALGTAFGILLIGCLWALRQRYNQEENIVQVMATIAFAYLSFYVSESILEMSGVIAVVFCALFTQSFASSMINDQIAMEKFWSLFEHILNTVLFTLGGLIWGTVIVGDRGVEGFPQLITGKEWGYLFLLYVFLMIIRSALVIGFYPIIGRIGLKSNWQEAVFMSWGGLRGAVGIALAILVENGWFNVNPEEIDGFQEFQADGALAFHTYLAHVWFFFAGGIAFLTLVINGTTAGPLLKKLGLAAPTEIRKSIVKRHRHSMSLHAIEHLLRLLANDQFSSVDVAVVRAHVSEMRDIAYNDIRTAVRFNRTRQPLHLYKEPNVSTFEPFLSAEEFTKIKELAEAPSMMQRLRSFADSQDLLDLAASQEIASEESSMDPNEGKGVSEEEMIEMRKVFISLLRSTYEKLVDKGFIDARASDFLVYKLTSSLERANDKVARGHPLNDWESCENSLRTPTEIVATGLKQRGRRASLRLAHKPMQKSDSEEYKKTAAVIQRVVACATAHQLAQEAFKEEFGLDRALRAVEQQVLDESDTQIELANLVVQSKNPADVRSIKAHLLCNILLNQMIHDVYGYLERGLLLQTEAEHIIHDLEHQIHILGNCDGMCDENHENVTAHAAVSASSADEEAADEEVATP